MSLLDNDNVINGKMDGADSAVTGRMRHWEGRNEIKNGVRNEVRDEVRNEIKNDVGNKRKK